MPVSLIENKHCPADVECCGRPLTVSIDYILVFPGRKLIYNIAS